MGGCPAKSIPSSRGADDLLPGRSFCTCTCRRVWLEFERLFLTAWRKAKPLMIRLESQMDDDMSFLPSGAKPARVEFDLLSCQAPPL